MFVFVYARQANFLFRREIKKNTFIFRTRPQEASWYIPDGLLATVVVFFILGAGTTSLMVVLFAMFTLVLMSLVLFAMLILVLMLLALFMLTLAVKGAQQTTVLRLVAHTVVTSLAALVLTVAAALAGIAAVVNRRMDARLLLADDWEASGAASGRIDGAARSSTTSAQNQTSTLVLVTIPIINPALAVGSATLVGQRGCVQEVVYINVGQVHS